MSSPTNSDAVERRTRTFHDDFGVTIHTYSWLPENPHTIVQIAHGVGEHALRYDAFARFLASHGIGVYADDHRGHGETGREQTRGDLARLGKLGPGGLRATEKAIVNFSELIRSAHPGVPLIYFGHSWGSLMGQRILNTGPTLYDGVVLSGSAYRHPKYMESGDLNQHHKHLGTTGFEWLSRDPETARAFAADELCFDARILPLFGLADSLRLFGVPNTRVPNVPMLIMSGTEDPIAVGNSLERLTAAYLNRGVQDVTLKLYPAGRHEMLNETNREEVMRDVLAWLSTTFNRSENPAVS